MREVAAANLVQGRVASAEDAQRHRANELFLADLDRAIDECQQALRSVFHSGAYALPWEELELLHDVSERIAGIRNIIILRESTPRTSRIVREFSANQRARAFQRPLPYPEAPAVLKDLLQAMGTRR